MSWSLAVRASAIYFKKVFTSCSTNKNIISLPSSARSYWKMTMESDDFERHLKTITIDDSTAFKVVMQNPELQALKEICDRYDMVIRMAGGPVRDILLNIVPHDIDFATTKTPDEMKDIFTKEEIRMIEYGPRATMHGTVTVRINDKENYEITTTRSDVMTDGRHAKVEFHKDWGRDAGRRDLTINAMFLGLDGKLYDYFNGYEDLKNRKVLFVGKAADRIQEDYLRIMRYFRFFGRISASAENHCKETLQTIKDNAGGLKDIAGERIWIELKKIVSGNYADDQIRLLKECGINEYIGLPKDSDPEKFATIYRKIREFKPTEITLLTSLMSDQAEVEAFHKRLKLSRKEYSNMSYIVKNRRDFQTGNIKHYKNEICSSKDPKFFKLGCIELAKYCCDLDMAGELSKFEPPKYPFSGKHLVALGIKGKNIAVANDKVRKEWMDSDFTNTEEELKEYAKELYQEGKLIDT